MNWIKIEDLSRFLSQFEPQLIHPDDPRWLSFWRETKKKCIEGVWFEDFGKWRYGRGNLGFYHHYTRIPDVDKVNKTHGKLIRPLIRDLEWHYSYNMLVARGFSGFDEDDKYTSDWRVFNAKKTKGLPADDELCLYKSDGTFKEFIEPYENVFRLHDKPVGKPLYNNDAKNQVVLGARGGGKATPLYTSIPTPNGWVKMKDLSVGDFVFDRNGNPTKVTHLHPQGQKEIYEVYLKDGRVIECCKDHLWLVKYNKKEQVLSTQEMLNKGLYYNTAKGKLFKFKVPINGAVQYPEKKLIIDPYVLGCLLGDGTLTTATPKIAIGDTEILENIKEKLKGFEFKYDTSTNNNYTIVDTDKKDIYIDTSSVKRFKSKGFYKKGGNRLTTAIRKLGLDKSCKEKFIPEIYMQGSIEQRLELLRGLLDTDGSCTKTGAVEFTSTNKKLAIQVLLLSRSLGLATSFGIDDRSHIQHEIKGHVCYKPCSYRVYINTTIPIFKISSKLNRLEGKKVTIYQTHSNITNIVATGKYTEMQCITVDCQDHTYLTDDYVVTHNSIYHINGEVFYDITFDGAKVYNEESIKNPNQILINVGAGIKGKSAKTLAFMKISSNFLKTSPEAGTWSRVGEDDWEPCPFYKEMTGTFDTDDERGWTNKFSVKTGTGWEERGTGSTVYHVSYSANKKTGAESGAGGRRSLIMYEEIGLFEDLLNAWGSDEAVVSVDGVQFAPRIGIGTSGNINTIKAAQKIFTHPDEYNCIGFKGKDNEKHCFFLPAYIVDKRFKDKNGNTDLEKAKKYYSDKLEEKLKTNDAAIINNWKMNYPIEIEHMWISSEGELLPGREAELREKQLLKNNLYESIGTPISLRWDNTSPEGVSYEVNPRAYPIYDDNFQDKESLEGTIMMYEPPFKINGKIPTDAHIITHDPYVSDAWDEGGSLGVTHVWINPKYIPYGAKGNCLAATYIGKHINGLDGYNKELEKLIAFYGNPLRQLWYEANRGERLRSHFLKRNKGHLLCLQPQFEQGQHIYLKNTTKTGFIVGSQISKIAMLDRLNDWLLEETEINGEVEKNIFRLPCIFTLRQIKDYTLKGNYDAVSSLMGFPLALGEIEHSIKEKLDRQKNPFGKMSKFLKQRMGQ